MTPSYKAIHYNQGAIWWDETTQLPLIHTKEERNTWTHIIIDEGVKAVPPYTFFGCEHVTLITMYDSLERLENHCFSHNKRLVKIIWSKKLKYIGYCCFYGCLSLEAAYIPSSCRQLDYATFEKCIKFKILSASLATKLCYGVILDTKLLELSPFEGYERDGSNNHSINHWIKFRHNGQPHLQLHKICFGLNPTIEKISEAIRLQGNDSMWIKDDIGVTAFEYLVLNPTCDMDVVNDFVLRILDFFR
ncbi:hypothetical protein CTEN210_03678 [Chaetoceros tenuissimus]|uniref:Uncharacterized protein n=1 Tax=Chaetoceros tenuissimus TaxID=426638 RepID=A0AAD3CKE4_9STRA|nr:hypothetical protein CTEN210_03678 [Chaetoceros tenuissimus]